MLPHLHFCSISLSLSTSHPLRCLCSTRIENVNSRVLVDITIHPIRGSEYHIDWISILSRAAAFPFLLPCLVSCDTACH